MKEEKKGWAWENASESERAYWQAPCEDGYYIAHKWYTQGRHSVLDLGCGLGRQSILFAKKGFEVTALDASREGLNQLETWAQREGVRVHTAHADIHALPFADNSFDCLWSYQVISHTDMAGLRKILAEIRRVLRPNAEVYLTLCSKAARAYKNAPAHDRVDDNVVYKREETGDRLKHVFVEERELPALFEGFTFIRVRHIETCISNIGRAGRAHYHIEALARKETVPDEYTSVIGRKIDVIIDRPMGSVHPRHKDIRYPINYGYVPGVMGGDRMEQDVYVLGVDTPREWIEGLRVIAVYHRLNDCEDKWIAAPEGMQWTDEEILRAIDFQERFFQGMLLKR